MDSTAPLFFVGVLVYGAFGAWALHLWQRRTGLSVSDNIVENFHAWEAHLLPLLVAVELYALLGGAALYVWVHFRVSLLPQNDLWQTNGFGLVAGVATAVAVFVSCDAVVVVLVRRMARRQADAHQDDPT